MSAGYGQNLQDYFAFYDPDTCLLRTSQGFLGLEWMKSLKTLPKSGMMRSGKLYRRQHLEHLTNGTGFSLWRTPDAHMGNRGPKSKEAMVRGYKVNLNDQVKHRGNLYPSPRVSMLKGATVEKAYSRLGKEHLEDVLAVLEGQSGIPNPMWVEWLQGLPLGWTDLEA